MSEQRATWKHEGVTIAVSSYGQFTATVGGVTITAPSLEEARKEIRRLHDEEARAARQPLGLKCLNQSDLSPCTVDGINAGSGKSRGPAVMDDDVYPSQPGMKELVLASRRAHDDVEKRMIRRFYGQHDPSEALATEQALAERYAQIQALPMPTWTRSLPGEVVLVLGQAEAERLASAMNDSASMARSEGVESELDEIWNKMKTAIERSKVVEPVQAQAPGAAREATAE